MLHSYRELLSIGTRAVRRRNLALFLILTCFASPIEVADAVPVTFQFDATVDNTAGNANGSVNVQAGDTIRGAFTYEPTPNGSRSEQLADLRFQFANLTLLSHEYEIRLENDQLAFPGEIPFDAASLGCSFSMSAVQCEPANIPQLNGWNWEAFINFSGGADVLHSSELLSNINWNEFSNRELRRTLTDSQSQSGLAINATINLVSAVPEAGSLYLMLTAVVALFLSRRKREP